MGLRIGCVEGAEIEGGFVGLWDGAEDRGDVEGVSGVGLRIGCIVGEELEGDIEGVVGVGTLEGREEIGAELGVLVGSPKS